MLLDKVCNEIMIGVGHDLEYEPINTGAVKKATQIAYSDRKRRRSSFQSSPRLPPCPPSCRPYRLRRGPRAVDRLILESGMIDPPCHKTADPDLAPLEASEGTGCHTTKWVSAPRGGTTILRSGSCTTFTLKTSSDSAFRLLHDDSDQRENDPNPEDL